jgi:2-oxoglutarate dehydrogenase E2 component (dihydrolipoamide succinyltransferase)
MSGEIRVPTLGESVSEATIARWLKKAGDAVKVDEPLVELETDKVSLEVPSPMAGVLAEIMAEEGTDVEVGALLGMIEEGEGTAAGQAEQAAKPEAKSATPEKDEAAPAPAKAPAKAPPPSGDGAGKSGPAARKLAAEKGLELDQIDGTGPKGNVTKGDVLKAEKPAEAPAAPSAKPALAPAASGGREERVKMTRLRKRIAERLKEAQNTAAMLTTFNEVDMSAVMDLRKAYQDAFVKKHGIKLGFMSFFVKACIDALKAFPAANSEIDGDEVVYKHYYDIGVAVSSDAGLVVPVVRGADAMNLAQIEAAIADLGTRAKSGKLAMDELTGGTFTITNGGIFGSMLSTPILNPPQVGILGMHNIVQRPVVVEGGRIEARPVMYLALSYDHRIIDGREAVSFLVRVKQCIEDPTRMLLDA